MDAQNAAAAASTKPSASSASHSASSRSGLDSDRPKPPSSSPSSTPAVTKSPVLSRAAPPPSASAKDTKTTSSKLSTISTDTPATAHHSKESAKRAHPGNTSPSASRDAKLPTTSRSASREKHDDDGGTDGNSEAETIVLSKDGSPAKPRSRKVIMHDDKRNGDSAPSSATNAAAAAAAAPLADATSSRKHANERKEAQSEKGTKSDKGDKVSDDAAKGATASSAATQQKRKRLQDGDKHHQSHLQAPSHPRPKDASSSLSSAPGSPPRSRQPSSHPHSGSDSERPRPSRSPKRSSSTTSKDRLRPPDKLISHKRKATKAESDDEAENRKARRLRLAGTGAPGDGASHSLSRTSKDAGPSRDQQSRTGNGSNAASSSNTTTTTTTTNKASASRSHREPSRNRSLSPQPRGHRRSLSTQLPSQSNGLGLKKRRIPAPLQTTDYHSDESSASGSPRVRSAKSRSLATPANAEPSASPAKIGPHKKHLDAHGQTFLARACARGEYELAKQRLAERPEDLNVADFAGNTPLQIASINGYGEIVKLLIDAGCNLDCVNNDRDTPLLDAVDNGHFEVVRLLLDAGVNPRKANVHGEEPLDRVADDKAKATEIRQALIEAKKKMGERRLTSEEHRHEHDDLRSLQGPDSPRRSPAPASAAPASTPVSASAPASTPAGGSLALASGRRAGTVRATKTSNHLLYMPMDDKTLRLAAGRGDQETVIRILQVRDAFDDPESMVAAARGGHDIVMQLLLALGKANPDPPPISQMPAEHATPMLAAIGQENIKVVSLLLDQSNFNPTQRFEGKTYYEIARQRAGPNWTEEEEILKAAYDEYKKKHNGKTKSPPRKDSDSRKADRVTETRETASARAHKRKASSPPREKLKKAAGNAKPSSAAPSSSTSPRDEKVSQKRAVDQSAVQNNGGKASPKIGNANSLPTNKQKHRDDRSSVTSNLDRDTPPPVKQIGKSKKADLESIAASSEGETVKPRRKLVSGRELKDGKVREKEREREREKQRRASLASTNTTAPSKDSASPREPRHDDDASDKIRVEKHRDRDRDRARQLKKEESKESGSGTAGEHSTKRHRSSETPPHVASLDRDTSEAPIKRRRLDAESSNGSSGSGSGNSHGKEKRPTKASASADDPPSKSSTTSSRPRDEASSAKASQRRREDGERKEGASLLAVKAKKREPSSDRSRRDFVKSVTALSEKNIHVKSEDVDTEMPDLNPDVHPPAAAVGTAGSDAGGKAQRDEAEDEKKKKADAEAQAQAQAKAAAAKRAEEEAERRHQEEEDKRRKDDEKRKKEEEKKQKQEEEAKRREEEERKKRELEAKKRREEEEEEERLKERKRLEEEERKRKEDEKRRREEEERKKREEEKEEKRRREEEVRKRKEEEEKQKKREEEERLHREQLEREAAEEARRKREEEERKERERQEQERIRAEKEAEELRRRRQQEEEERIRIAKLPPLLQWLSGCANPKSASIAKKFKTMQGVRYDCINANATGSPEGREQWLMNTQVALVLGDKDLSLSRYPSWRRLPMSMIAKRVIWRLESDRYALTDPELYEFGKQLKGYYGAESPETMSYLVPETLRRESWEKFSTTDMFFVQVSDVMSVIPSLPHLRDIRLTVVYRELPEDPSQLLKFTSTQKWKMDPDSDRFHGFAPRNKYYVNGQMVREEHFGMSPVSKTPFPEVRVPRRGFVAVPIDDPDFARLCKEQGINPSAFPSANHSPSLPNGAVHSPDAATGKTNGRLRQAFSGVVNGNSNGNLDTARSISLPNGPLSRPIVNGFHSTKK